MQLRYLILLRIAAAITATVAFCWFLLPNCPAEAVADGMTARAGAGHAGIMINRFRVSDALPNGYASQSHVLDANRTSAYGEYQTFPGAGDCLGLTRRGHSECNGSP